MNGNQDNLQSVFTKNRTEEFGYDVWEYFVVPPFFTRLDLEAARKPRVIIGGRGCGKTMLLRYLSHQSLFSPKRLSIPDHVISHIGLYWRADTQFAHAMMKRGLEPDVWQTAFNHLLAITLSAEVLRSLHSIAFSTSTLLQPEDLASLDFSRLQSFDTALPKSFSELLAALEDRLSQFQTWVNNVRTMPAPLLLPGTHFILSLITRIQEQHSQLRDATYFVYIDEYENLVTYQQELINTALKHSQPPLIFNLATKRNGFQTRKTVGSESIMDLADYREHDLEDYLSDDFPLFASEILFLKLSTFFKDGPIDVQALRDPAALAGRRDEQYRERVLTAARHMFPDCSQEELATEVFADNSLLNNLRKWVDKALKEVGSDLPAEHFIRQTQPQASIVTPAVLYRRTHSPEFVLNELDKLERGEDSKFRGTTDWIHNNFVGCLLRLYEPHSRTCPVYAGFRTFCHLAKGNIRHFLELCHKSIDHSFRSDGFGAQVVPVRQQAEAARQVSAAFLGEIRSFGQYGNRLHTFVLWLGSLFALAHQRPSQSEPEQSHFAIRQGGTQELTEADWAFLNEAVKWSVLFEETETKKKSTFQPESIEYVLNPIYAPYFHITYRKRRKLEIRTDDLIVLIRGTYDQASTMLRRFSKTWSVNLDEVHPTLFAHLHED